MKKRLLIIAMLLLMGATVLCGCNGDVDAEIDPKETISVPDTSVDLEVDKKSPSEVAPVVDLDAAFSEIVDKSDEPEAEPEVVAEPDEPEVVAEPDKPEVVAEPEPEKEPATAVSISAKVSGTHYVGDTLTAADFTITVNMSDGSTVKNPAGWNADKLTLDSESTVITVTYNGLSTTVTVKAQQKQQAQPQQPATEPEPSVGEPPIAGGWPASAYGAVTDAAIADCYNYAVAHGWVAETQYTDAFGGGSSIVYVKNGQEFNFCLGYLCWNSTLYFPGEYTMADAYRLIDSV